MNVRPGIEILLEQQVDLIAGRRVGLIANPTSVDRTLISSIERLNQHPQVQLGALFGPEHGIRGSAQAGDEVSTATDPITGLSLIQVLGVRVVSTQELVRFAS